MAQQIVEIFDRRMKTLTTTTIGVQGVEPTDQYIGCRVKDLILLFCITSKVFWSCAVKHKNR